MHIGTAGWTIPAIVRPQFAPSGTQLQRYAARLTGVEINSTFYRAHRPATYARWAADVPDSFAFALKIPKQITHVRRCVDCTDELSRFLDDTSALGTKRRVLLVQLPPSFVYDDLQIGRFFAALRERYAGFATCEPRHASWFEPQADAALQTFQIGRVAADPALSGSAASPGGWPDFVYYRQHGSPRIYYSCYELPEITALAQALAASTAAERWCVFDNTAAGAALQNALELVAAVAWTPAAAALKAEQPAN